MDEQALTAAHEVAARYLDHLGADLLDSRTVVKAVLVGYLAASGVPADSAVAAVEQMAARGLVGPMPANPMYHGLPWLVPGPASGAPYYR